MVLEYIWIKDYGVIKNQGFNFNPNVFYSFDMETGELNKKSRDEIPTDFFNLTNDTITNISALIGANGTGKTTVLEFISSFLSYHRPLGGFIITSKEVINKSDIEIKISRNWFGEIPILINRVDLIKNHRRANGLNDFDEIKDTKNIPLGLRILDNLITDTRLIYYSGETNLGHTNRVFQSLLSMADEFENSKFTEISDIAVMKNDQRIYRSDKAIYSGENPVLAHRSGESQRFLELMLGDYKKFIPFPIDCLSLSINFSDIDKVFFESYDEMAFRTIVSLLKSHINNEHSKISKKLEILLQEIETKGIGGYFEEKFFYQEDRISDKNIELYLYHNLLLRHIREQIMETLGELTERDKIKHFISLIIDFDSFTTSKSYIYQIKDYFSKSEFAKQFTGSLNLEATDVFYNNLKELDLWKYDSFRVNLSEQDKVNKVFSALSLFKSESGLNYNVSTIFDFEIKGLSTGEKQFLKIFSRFFSYNLNNLSNHPNENQYIILIDEFDLGFHPLWQRKFLKTWIDFLETFINQNSEPKIKVQLIITSHSPFIVSDLPKQCINFLSKKENEENSKVDLLELHKSTFGANIHELFSDSFFLSGALMGDFAKSKIDNIINDIQSNEPLSNPDYLRTLIQIIGEPIIQIKLAEMLADKLGENIESSRLLMQQEYINQRLKQIEINDSNKTNTTKKS